MSGDTAIYLGAPKKERPTNPRHSKGRDGHRLTGKFPSWKNDKTFAWNEPLDRDFMTLLEADPGVESYQFRAECWAVYVGGKWQQHVVGFKVKGPHGAWRFDVARPDRYKRLVASGVVKQLIAGMAEFGWRYRLLPDWEVKAEPRLSNAQRLLRGRMAAVRRGLDLEVSLALQGGQQSLGELASTLGCGAAGIDPLLALATRGLFEIDLTEPISRETYVRIREAA